MVGDRCPSCSPTPTTSPTNRTRRVVALALLVAAPGLLAVALTPWLIDSRTQDLREQVVTLAERNAALDEAATTSKERLDDALVRLGALESAAASHPDTAVVVARVKESVFTVIAGDGSGSAWVVGSAGGTSRLITNYHVVRGVWKDGDRRVQLIDGDQTWDGTITDVSEGSDLAVIEVQASFPVLEQAPTVPAVGDPVLAFGSPLGLDDTVSTGIVSALRTDDLDDYIQFSAPVSPGSSGGPLVDQNGRVVGVTVMKAQGDGVEGLGFAIPVDLVCDVVAC